jgi:hypothetical protein
MRLVVLSNLKGGPGFVARCLVQRFPETRVVEVQQVPWKSSWTRRLKNAFRGTWLRSVEHRAYYRHFFERGERRLEELLYGAAGVSTLDPVAQVPSTNVNHASTATLLASLRPDVLLVAGAPLLKPSIFTIPRLAAVNVHFGISPRYRGEHTLFWPLYYRDYRNVGVTIHLIDSGIDTGRVLAQGFIETAQNDDEWTFEAKAAQFAANLMVELITSGNWQPSWRPPMIAQGRAYRFNQRRIWHDALLSARKRWLGERLPAMRARSINYCIPPGGAPISPTAAVSAADD